MRRLIALAASAAAAATVIAAPGASALPAECGAEGNPSLGIVGVDTPAGRYYVDDRNFVLGNGTWVYKENTSNTTLQRRAGTAPSGTVGAVDKALADNGSTETCTDTPSGKVDILVF